MAKTRKITQAEREAMDCAGLFFVPDFLYLPVPTQVQQDTAAAFFVRDFPALHAMRCGARAERLSARNTLLLRHRGLVRLWAKRYYRSDDDGYRDTVQIGILGLMRALESFDYTRGFKLSTYVSNQILQKISRAMENGGVIRIPVHRHAGIRRYEAAKRALAQELGREPSPEEIREKLHLSANQFRMLLQNDAMRSVLPFSDIINAHEDKTGDPSFLSFPVVGDTSIRGSVSDDAWRQIREGPESAVASAELRTVIRAAFAERNGLVDRERQVLILRYGLSDGITRSLEEVGQELLVTRERIRQIEAKALRKLRGSTHLRELWETSTASEAEGPAPAWFLHKEYEVEIRRASEGAVEDSTE